MTNRKERRRSKGEGPNGFGLARPRMRAKYSASGRLGSFLQARAYAKQQTTRKQIGGRWWGSRTGATALRMVVQVSRQCTHRSSKVNKGFFLCEQRCSVDQALASHVRGKRKFNP
jgi:hypothetical protein